MTDAVDIYRAAKLVIDRHDEDAPLYAGARTAVLAGKGDVENAAVWVRSLRQSRSCSVSGGRASGKLIVPCTRTGASLLPLSEGGPSKRVSVCNLGLMLGYPERSGIFRCKTRDQGRMSARYRYLDPEGAVRLSNGAIGSAAMRMGIFHPLTWRARPPFASRPHSPPAMRLLRAAGLLPCRHVSPLRVQPSGCAAVLGEARRAARSPSSFGAGFVSRRAQAPHP